MKVGLCQHLEVEPLSARLYWRGREVDLNIMQYRFVTMTVNGKSRWFNRQQLLDGIYGVGADIYERTVDGIVKTTIRKFKAVDPAFDRIEGRYGIGYRFRGDEDERYIPTGRNEAQAARSAGNSQRTERRRSDRPQARAVEPV